MEKQNKKCSSIFMVIKTNIIYNNSPYLWQLMKHMPQKGGFKDQKLAYIIFKLDNSWKQIPLINLTFQSCSQYLLACVWFRQLSILFLFNLSYRLYLYIFVYHRNPCRQSCEIIWLSPTIKHSFPFNLQ